ncbi:terminase [Neisseria sp. N95_16]|uniref:Terminase n=1 Tax=Neisseria brasiliensis TaxID=2666100 RepID=A0A5Q3RUL3_9NEIS|nr:MULTISPECIES: phage terminase small subunit [Neisseria]MRN37191.1 terminase [Neisseria brasiliensis]PJO10090.1 terminase [Neisseria sp. N95_16]PJO78754.1 terminase [Neisseria sp. N177_16]QGL24200.1 terminase [Neisseria brasiliensis]
MTSPARAHKQAILAAKSAEIDLTAAEPYQRLQYLLAQDRQMLKQIKGIPDKITAKRQAIEKYRDWLNQVYESGQANQDDVIFTTGLLWLVDIGELETAAPLIEFAIAQNMVAADEFKRDLKDRLFEEMAEQLANNDAAELSEQAASRLIEQITAINPDTGLHELNIMDQIRAKFLKACGERVEDAAPARALELYEKAVSYNANVGVKKRIEALKKQLAA